MRPIEFIVTEDKMKIKKGYFHCWGTAMVEVQRIPINDTTYQVKSKKLTVGIVEDEKGYIYKVEPHCIQFTDKPKQDDKD